MNYGSVDAGSVSVGDVVYVADCEDEAAKGTWFPAIAMNH